MPALLAGAPGKGGFWSVAGQGTLLLRHVGALSGAGAAALGPLLEQRSASGVGPLLILTGTPAEYDQLPRLPQRYVIVQVPPLRAHADDILPFAAAWLPNRVITFAAAELLHAYVWPGNLGELRAAPLPNAPIRLPPEGLSLEELEIALIRQALQRAGGNKSRAAELLGLTRHTLLYRLEKYKI